MMFRRLRRKAEPILDNKPGEPTPEDLLANVTSALADQLSQHTQLGHRLKTLESQRDRLEDQKASDQDLALVYSEIDEIERLRTILTASVGSLRTSRTAIQSSVHLNSVLTQDQLRSIQMDYEKAQQSQELTHEYTDLIRETGDEVASQSQQQIDEMLRRGTRRRSADRAETAGESGRDRRRESMKESEE